LSSARPRPSRLTATPASSRRQVYCLRRQAFIAILRAGLAREEAQARRARLPLVARLNVVSDVAWEREHPALFAGFPLVQFMDYTKDVSRVLDPARPANYHLTFSRSESNDDECRRVLAAGHNVTVVFRRSSGTETNSGRAGGQS
jgi:hypothetical protein